MSVAFEHFETHPGVANGALERLCVHYSAVPHTPPTAEAFERGLRRMHYAHGKSYFLLMVNNVSQPGMLSEETRARFAKTLREAAILPTAAAILILSPGLLGVTTRSVVTGLLIATRPSTPCQVFSTAPQAVAWLAQQAKNAHLSLPALPLAESVLDELKQRAHGALRPLR